LNVRLPYNFYRTYDPATGRYLEADPIGQFGLMNRDGGVLTYVSAFNGILLQEALARADANLYVYGGQNPIVFIDPFGLASCTYSIGTHTMTCAPSNPNNPAYNSSNAVSGRNTQACPDCQNNPNRTGVQTAGPIPAGTYTVGPQLPGSTRRNLIPQTNIAPRFGFQTHGCANPMTCSEGCIGFTTNPGLDAFNSLIAAEPNSTVTVQP